METFIRLALRNFPVTFLVLGLVAAALSLARRPRPRTAAVAVEDVFAYYLLFSVGVGFLYNFVMHVFFGATTARFIGWEDSPFQAEVGMASLGYAAVGFLAFRGGFGMRAAAVVGPACFALGAAGVHIHQIVVAHNFAPGNAGLILVTDVGGPLLGLMLLRLQHRLRQPTPGPE
jgi:hypothetical protein